MCRQRNGICLGLGVLLLALLQPLVARAQGGSDGSIIGYVFDQAGNPLRGVRIQASSPTQIGGAKSTYTNEEGMFRMRQLFPGTFEVNASAPKLKAVVLKDVKVGISAAAEVNIVMEVQTKGVEEVTIVEKAPTVSTTTTNVKEVYDLEFVESLPMAGRDQVFNQMVGQIGGAVGNRIRGGAGNQTVFTQDGFDMRDQYPVTKATAAYEINSAGYGADNPTAAGGAVNLVTKTGSNKWEFDFNATFENDTLRFGKDNRDGPGNFYYVVNPAIAGPLMKDRLWFAFAYESHMLGNGGQADPQGIRPISAAHTKTINKGTLKLTWQMTMRNKLTFLSNFDSATNKNLKTDNGIEAESQQNRRAGLSGLWGLIWEAILTDDLVLRSQAAYSRRPQFWYPAACEASDVNLYAWPWLGGGPSGFGECDIKPGKVNRYPVFVETEGVAYGCAGTGNCENAKEVPFRRYDLDVYQAGNRLEYFLDSKALGEHRLVLKHQYYTEVETRREAQPGDYFEEWNGEVPEARTTFYANDPRYQPEHFGWWIATDTITRNTISLSDSWRPTRHLTLTPALSYVWTNGQNHLGNTVVDLAGWAPSIAGAWDATHDGRTVIRASYSQYLDVAIRDVVLSGVGSQVKQRCLWNTTTQAYDKDCTYSGGASKNTVGLPCGPSGIDAEGKPCNQQLTVPRTYEYTLGVEREIAERIALSLDLVYRKYANQYETNETNRIWDPSGSSVLGYRTGKTETITDVETPEGAQRHYRGVTIGLNKREGQLKVYLSYTLSRLTGTVFNGSNNRWGDIPGRDVYLDGSLPDDSLHDVKATGTYSVTKWLAMGVRYQFRSGFPYSRLYRNQVTGSYEDYRAPIGWDPGTSNINDPATYRQLRYPNIQDLNVQASVNLASLIGHNLAFSVDALNVLNLRTPTGYGQNQGQNFGVETGWMAPFRVRLQMNYRY